jgi:hypothetical protein
VRSRYGLLLVLTTLVLTAGAIFSFAQIGALPSRYPMPSAPWLADVPRDTGLSPVLPGAADYARFADADRAWREAHARQYTIEEIRARGDGRRTPRQAMQDRVYTLIRDDQRARAIVELERWVNAHRSDAGALLWLARLLNEAGRTDESLRRYRQLIALQEEH